MALGMEGDEIEATPTSIVAPWNMDIDPSTMQFDPQTYMNMAGDFLSQQFGGQHFDGPIQGLEEVDETPQGPIQGLRETDYEPHPQADPLIKAIDHGYADKSFMNPVKMIRDGVAANNHEMIEKDHTKLTEMLSETHLSPTDKFMDILLGRGVVGNAQRNAQKIAADVIAHELQRPGSTRGTTAAEAVNLGTIKQSELLPRQLSGPSIPAQSFNYGSDGGDGMAQVMTHGMQPSVDPDALLTPYQQATVTSRQQGLSAAQPYRVLAANARATAADAQSRLADQRAKTEEFKREFELPAKIKGHESMNDLRKQQVEFYKAKTEWTKQLPSLRRELQNGNPLEMEAMKRVHGAIKAHEPIEPADWLIAKRWLTKGIPEYGLDFMGNTYSKVTGEKGAPGKGFKPMGIPTPPDTSLTPEQTAEAEEIHGDMFSQIKEFLGGLLSGSEKEDSNSTKKPPAVKLPTPKTPEDAAKLKPGTQYLRPDGRVMVR